MTAQELIKRLQALDPETIVHIASDEEWNNVRPVYELDYGWLLEDGDEVRGIADEDVGEYYEESELFKGATLW